MKKAQRTRAYHPPERVECLIEKCTRQSSIRGLCTSHYQVKRLEVSKKKTSWKKLEKAGLALPPSRGRKKP